MPTEWARQTFLASGVAADKLRVLPQPVDTEFFSPLSVAARYPLPAGRPVSPPLC